MDNGMLIFSGSNNRSLTQSICDHLNITVGRSQTELFPDGEMIVRLQEDVRGKDCYVVVSTGPPVNDNIMELLIFCDCLKRASARQIIPVIPYFGYGRQDRKDKGRVPISAKLLANMITTAGAHRVLTLDLHAAQIQGFFDIPLDHLSGTPVFLDYFQEHRDEYEDLVMVSPDVGNVKVAEGLSVFLDADIAIIHKSRDSGTEVTPQKLVGDVEGKTVLMFDDMISTAGTMVKAAEFVTDHGAKKVICAATHGLFAGGAEDKLIRSLIEKVIVTDTLTYTPFQSFADGESALDVKEFSDRLEVLSVAPLIGEAIHRIYNNRSISELFGKTEGIKR